MSVSEEDAVQNLESFPAHFRTYKEMSEKLGVVFKRDKARRESQLAKLGNHVYIVRNGRQITFTGRRGVRRISLDFRAGSVWQHLSSVQLLRTILLLGRNQGVVAEVTLPRWELPEYLGVCNGDFAAFVREHEAKGAEGDAGAVRAFLEQAQAQARTVINGAVSGLVSSGAVVHYPSYRTEFGVLGVKESVAVSGVNGRVCHSLGLRKACARSYVPRDKLGLFDRRTRDYRAVLGIYGTLTPSETFIFDIESVELALADSMATVRELNKQACEKLEDFARGKGSSDEFLQQWMRLVATLIKLHGD